MKINYMNLFLEYFLTSKISKSDQNSNDSFFIKLYAEWQKRSGFITAIAFMNFVNFLYENYKLKREHILLILDVLDKDFTIGKIKFWI